MSFTRLFTPVVLALAVLAAILLVRGIRARSAGMIGCSVGIFVLTGVCISLVMEFITRM